MGWLLEWKLLRIESALNTLLINSGVTAIVRSFGPHYIDPGQLVFVVCVPLDRERDMLRGDYQLLLKMRKLLDQFNWPVAARDRVHFDIESQETVDREDDGNWWCHYTLV